LVRATWSKPSGNCASRTEECQFIVDRRAFEHSGCIDSGRRPLPELSRLAYASRWSRSHFSGGCRVRPGTYGRRPCCSSPSDLDRLYQKPEFESAPVSIFSQNLDPPIAYTSRWPCINYSRIQGSDAPRRMHRMFLRNGANRWHLYGDLHQPNIIRMEVVMPSWKQHLLQRERMTKDEQEVLLKLRSLRTDPNPPQEWISLSLEKEVLNRRVRTGGLPPGYIDQ